VGKEIVLIIALPTSGRNSSDEETGFSAIRSASGVQAASPAQAKTISRESIYYRPINKELGFRSIVRAKEEIASDASWISRNVASVSALNRDRSP